MQPRRISVDEPAGGAVPNFSLNSIAEQPEEEARASGSFESGPVSLQDELRMCNEYIWVRRKSSAMPSQDRCKSVFAKPAPSAAAVATQTEDSWPPPVMRASSAKSETASNYKDIFREIFSVLARAREDSAAAATTTTAAAAAVGIGGT